VWYYHAVVFIESLAFTRRLHELAKTDAVEVLTAIQSDLLTFRIPPNPGTRRPRSGLLCTSRAISRLRWCIC
jgi:hypothetical protein